MKVVEVVHVPHLVPHEYLIRMRDCGNILFIMAFVVMIWHVLRHVISHVSSVVNATNRCISEFTFTGFGF